MKIKGLEKALESVPEEEREEVKKAVLEMFSGLGPGDDLPGKPVERIGQGIRDCPSCGTALEQVGDEAYVMKDELLHIFECPGCDTSYCRTAMS
jgi:hypothetical protein